MNTIRSRTIGAIALNPTGDDTGTYRFMSLKTGQVLTKGAGSWTEVPITDIAIAWVEALAKHEGQPLVQDSNLLVEWRPNQPFDEDDEYDDDYKPSVVDGEDNIELEIDDISETTEEGETVTHHSSQTDPPVISPIPEQLVHPSVEEVGVDTPVEDDLVAEEDSNISAAENEGAVTEDEGADHPEEEGAFHMGEEGAKTDAGNGHDAAEHNADRTRGGYNLRPDRIPVKKSV